MIPRIRRLRRRVGAWACVRLGVAACATWLGWRYRHAGAGVASLVGALLLFAFSLLVRAKPEVKSADAIAAELGALIVLNGGIFQESPDSTPIQHAQIFVHPEQIIVLGPRERRLLEIPSGESAEPGGASRYQRNRRRRRALGSGNQLGGRWALHNDLSL